MEKITGSRWFNLASWGITAIMVAGMTGFAYTRLQSLPAALPGKTAPEETQTVSSTGINISWLEQPAIERKLTLKTIIPQRPRYDPLTRTVQRGDSIGAIAKEFNIKADTLLFANYDLLEDNPDGLRPGQELNIPPTDGILYQWKNGDTLDKVAAQYKASPQDILGWPGNKIDLTDPKFKASQWVMIPDGSRASLAKVIDTAGNTGKNGCPPAGASRSFWVWPAANHFLSGNDFSAGHPGIDIAAREGDGIFAANNGVVTMSQDGWNYGYGNVIQIDHGGGYVTLYAHLSVRNVSKCQSVFGGQLIGAGGNTGNSFGAHLHFEIRLNGSHVNPWDYLP